MSWTLQQVTRGGWRPDARFVEAVAYEDALAQIQRLEDETGRQRYRIGQLRQALQVALDEMLSMNEDLTKIGKGRNCDGAHPDCAIEVARTAMEVFK